MRSAITPWELPFAFSSIDDPSGLAGAVWWDAFH